MTQALVTFFGKVNGHLKDLWKILHLLVRTPKVHSVKLLDQECL